MDSFINRSMESDRCQPMHGTGPTISGSQRTKAISEVALEFIAPPHIQIEDEGENAARHAPERTLFGHYFKHAEPVSFDRARTEVPDPYGNCRAKKQAMEST